jgi:drug/metabolite transporter (DMT)-like permease
MGPTAAPAPASRALDATGAAALVLCCAIWGLNQVAMKIVNDGISPILQSGLRALLATVLILGWARLRKVALVVRDGTLWPGIAAGLLFAANFLTFSPGLAFTEASRAVLFYYSAPFFVALGAHFLVPGDRLTLAKCAGLALAFLGLAIVVGERPASGREASLAGDLLCLAGGFFWAAGTLTVRTTALRRAVAERTLLYQLVVSAPIMVAFSLAIGEPGIIDLSPRILAWFAFTVVIVVFFSYVLWLWVISVYPPSQASVFTFLAPMFAVAAAHLVLGEPLTPRLLAALALVAAGIGLVNRRRP